MLAVVARETLGMGDQTTRVVDKGDQEGFLPGAVSQFDAQAVHRIGLPEFVSVLHGKRLAQLLGDLGLQ